MFYVYVIYSANGDCYYRGFSEQPIERLGQHNNAESRYTSRFDDWKLFHLEEYSTKKEALIREKRVKKYSKSQIVELSKSSKNMLHKFHSDH